MIELFYNLTDDSACRRGDVTTRQLSVAGRRCLDPLCRGVVHAVYTDKQLYTQLSYFSYLFDVPHALDKVCLRDRDRERNGMEANCRTFFSLQLDADRALGESLLQGHIAEYEMCKRNVSNGWITQRVNARWLY